MAEKVIHSHSYEHFEDMQASSKEFYEKLESQIKEYQFPGVSFSFAEFGEDGPWSPKRTYFCITRRFLSYYVCAAPFGRSFFVSWWLKDSDDSLATVLRRIPIIRWFLSPSKPYYQIDTELIFKSSIDGIIRGAVASLKAEHGYRIGETAE
ncbi:hypothetical protein ACFGVS_19055 [Mucilaginibacter sp. AW1-7]|uniref:hypothetical protein n=1 Tax=Mucilaginibacter sp. AW1-7 TaxID=3349874 RepID=UPI003F732623